MSKIVLSGAEFRLLADYFKSLKGLILVKIEAAYFEKKLRIFEMFCKAYNIDIEKIEAKISKNTKAIMPVNLYGQAAELYVFQRYFERWDLRLQRRDLR